MYNFIVILITLGLVTTSWTAILSFRKKRFDNSLRKLGYVFIVFAYLGIFSYHDNWEHVFCIYPEVWACMFSFPLVYSIGFIYENYSTKYDL